MAKRNVIIVGAGLFGSMAATLARRRGHTVTVIDNNEKYAASKASGCVLAPSWLTSLSNEQREGAMEVIRELYTVVDIPFGNTVQRLFKAQAVNPDSILVKPDVVDTVEAVGGDMVHTTKGEHFRGHVLVAAGIWSQKLVPDMPKVVGLYGASLRLWGVRVTPFIRVYAPYRQAVCFNLSNREAWFGDGTALSEKTWMKEEPARIEATIRRYREFNDSSTVPPNRIRARVGARPYVEGYKAGYFAQHDTKLWVSCGGAKNGTVLAAWQARQFVEAL